jgi:pyruvate,water dikinase
MQSIVWLEDIGAADADLAGDKAAGLGEVMAAGFPVPTGFVVTADAYREAVANAGIAGVLATAIDRRADMAACSAYLQGLVRKADVPAGVHRALAAAYHRLAMQLSEVDPPVVVRTSVVGEDVSFAGTAAPVRNVKGIAGLVDAVELCWAALFNERALIGRASGDVGHEPAMAVIVQPQLSVVRSGTAFTVDPVRERDDLVLINARFGEDETKMAGRVACDTYLVSRETSEVVESRIGEKVDEVVAGPRRPVTVTLEGRRYPRVLSDSEATRIAALSLAIEGHSSHPQQVDWCLGSAGAVYVVQAGPIGRHRVRWAGRPEPVAKTD